MLRSCILGSCHQTLRKGGESNKRYFFWFVGVRYGIHDIVSFAGDIN